MYLLGDPPDYEQPLENTLGARAQREGRKPEELAYDAMLEQNGRGMLYVPFANYADGNLEPARDAARPGLGAGPLRRRRPCRHHLRCQLPDLPAVALDARPQPRRTPAAFRSWWRRRRARPRCSVGLNDRGVIGAGYNADLNVIDYDRLTLRPPEVHYDLPIGGRRLLQPIDGYEATIVSGAVTQRDGKPTGARPGRLVRGVRPDPKAERQLDAAQ